jgi:hypothetical protein
MRILTHGIPLDIVDEYVHIAESTARQTLQHFYWVFIDDFDDYYLRAPIAAAVVRLL